MSKITISKGLNWKLYQEEEVDIEPKELTICWKKYTRTHLARIDYGIDNKFNVYRFVYILWKQYNLLDYYEDENWVQFSLGEILTNNDLLYN